ncbi:hypothetical protein V5O48_011157 [Marasmius crinis-equi]|uniref:Major facilitator superfamily (MFS) profile domain-containing protein n=1 Tax=Marasmius crinis-equi TaxID=585013 RepID=A0ABR3F6E4_9AGAR
MTSVHTSVTENEKTDRIEDPNGNREVEDPLPEPGTPERIAAERLLVRKLDRRVLPTIILIYIMNYIDRLGITTARLQGLENDLHLTSTPFEHSSIVGRSEMSVSDHLSTLEHASLPGALRAR